MNPEVGVRCGACRLGLGGEHRPGDPQCLAAEAAPGRIELHPSLTPGASVVHRDLNSRPSVWRAS